MLAPEELHGKGETGKAFAEHRRGVVGRAVVDNDQLDVGVGLCGDRCDRAGDRARVVVHGQYDAYGRGDGGARFKRARARDMRGDQRFLALVGLRRKQLGKHESQILAYDRVVPAGSLRGVPQQVEGLAPAPAHEHHDAEHVQRVDVEGIGLDCLAIERLGTPEQTRLLRGERLEVQCAWRG